MLKEPLALVGMSCRLPGGDGLDEFWKLVAQGATAWGSLPADRLNRDLYFAPEKGTIGKSYSELGGLISSRPVDQSVCPLTNDHKKHYDIAHQVFLEVASRACRDAGLDPFAMPKHSRTGVYVGHTGGSAAVGDYVYSTRIDEAAHLLHEVDVARELLGDETVKRVSEDVTTAVRRRYPGRKAGRPIALSALDAARLVREALQLEGPYLVVDAACASSLQALAIASRALNAGSIDQAIVGGASYCKSDSLVLFSAAQSVSNKGSCPFGKNADGLVTAEGYVALVLKTLSKAVEDGDRIRAVIRGIGVASDGKGKSLWAPRQEGQTLAVQRAYPKKEDLSEIEYIEAHATSTQVGDATELGALAGLLSRHIPSGKKVPIGSVKANVGHTLETAGLASLVKVVLAMEHNLIPPGTTADELNDDFDWRDGPFRVPKSTEKWERREDGKPRLAAVNAFGIGGLNVHLAISEHVGNVTAVRPAGGRNQLVRDEPIAIVGTGCVLPGALSVSEFEKMLAEGRSAIQAVLPERWSLERAIDPTGPTSWHAVAGLGGFVEGFAYDWRRHKVPPKQIAAANPLQFMLLEAADSALADAGLKNETWDRTRVSVVVGTMFGGDFSNDLQIGLRLPETAVILTDLLQRHGLSESQIAEVLSAYEKKVLERFPALVDETGSFTSSTLASRLTKSFDLMGGALALDAGDCSSTTAIAAAVDMLRDGSSDAVLCAAGQRYLDLVAYEMLSLRGSLASRPRTALDLDGEGRVPGEGAVVLVMKRLSDAQAAGDTIHGVIRDVCVSAGEQPEVTATRVMDNIFESTQIPHEAVVTSEYSGVAHRERDKEVLKSLAARAESGSVHPVSSLDGQIGHLGAAAGAAGVLKLMNAVRSGSLPAAGSIPDELTVLDHLRVSSKLRPLPVASTDGYRAGSLTEVNDDLIGHLVLDNGLSLPREGSREGSREGKQSSSMSPAPQNKTHMHGNTGRIAALFPGQGSQYTGMFQGLAKETPEGQVVLAELDELARSCQAPTLAEVAWKSPNKMGSGVWETQWAMYLGDLFAWKVLKAMGFRPDCIASHSFGEFPALAAAGCWSEAIGFRATKARAEAVEQHGPPDGAMLSILAGAEVVQSAIKPFDSLVWRCAENAPEQTVVGGTSRAIDAVELLLEPTRTRAKRLAVPSPFHTPLLKRAAAELSQTLDLLPITESQFPILSSTTLNVLSTPATVRTSLVRQMTETVRWVQVVKQLYEQGVRTFVEVGPGAVLSGLVRRILADCRDITIVQFDQRGRTSAEQMARLQDTLGLSAGAVQAGASAQHGTNSQSIGVVSRFDATARRRERNRDAAAGGREKQALKPVAKAEAPPSRNGTHAARFDYVASARNSSQRQDAPTQNGFAKPRGAGASIVDVPSALSQPHSRSEMPASPKAGILEVESFLIDFVIEQTGYPREIVELDADLEADLGIDSIRKAQLFGEIGQKYDLQADDELSLDDFPTLRHLLEYMQPRIGGGDVRANDGDRSVSSVAEAVDIYRSSVFLAGEEKGRRDREKIQQWARRLSSSMSFQDSPVFSREIGEELDGVAFGAGVSASVVRAAMARPFDAIGTFDIIASVQPEETGVALGFGRHVAPHAEAFTNDSVVGGSLSIPGLPGMLCGWNQNGIIAWIDCLGQSVNENDHTLTPAAIAVDHVIRTAHSTADATEQLRQLCPLGTPVFLLGIGEQQICRVEVDGDVTVLANEMNAVRPESPLDRISLHDGQRNIHDAVLALVGRDEEEQARMSATSHWLALGVFNGKAYVHSGGPIAQWCPELSESLRGLQVHQSKKRPSTKGPVHDRETPSVTRRYVVDHCEMAAAGGDRRLAGERVLVFGSGKIADAVAAEIRQRGADAVVASCGGYSEAKQFIQQQESIGAVTHLVIASAAGKSSAGTYSDLQVLLESVFFTCQQWIIKRTEAGDIRDATLTAVTRLGGQFGIDSHIDNVAGGGLTGLFKNIAREFPDLQVRVVDHAREARPSEIAHSTVTELCTKSDIIEVGYRAATRLQMASQEAIVPEVTTPLEAVSRGSVWLVTGGARGVTAACARAFGKQYGLRLALVGSTELVVVEPRWLDLDDAGMKTLKGRLMVEAKQRGEDPRRTWTVVEKTIEIRRSLAAFDAEGIEAHYFPCDLSNQETVRQMVADVQHQVGPVRGIVHGAGFESACRFEKKTHAGFSATVFPKALGLEYLLAATDEKMLGAVIGFGSTSGRFGGHGQADYAMANDLLAKIVGRVRADRNIPATVFHWHAWDEVGMASRPESRFVLEQFGLKFMPLAEGVQHFLDEIASGLLVSEVIVTEPAFCEAAGVTKADAKEKGTGGIEAIGSLVKNVNTAGEGASVRVDLDPTQDMFLVEHTQYGRPLLPAVMAAELIAQSALAAGATRAVREIRDVTIQRPFGFSTATKREATITVGQNNGSGEVPVVGWAAVQNTAGRELGDPREHFSGTIAVDSQGTIENVLDEQLFPFNPMVYQEDAPLRHGQSFRTLSGLFLDRSGGWGRVTAPDPNIVAAPRGADGWTVPIALLDGCIVGCAVYSYILLGKRVEVPLRFERLRFADTARKNEKCTVRMFYRSHDERESIYDFTLYGSDSRPILALDGLHLACVPSRQES
ncbi:MAG: SDR family oxidoreductase [Pirellulales bacterium]|nr:SDR family oxidoreductase [Pirellulales bacterium]